LKVFLSESKIKIQERSMKNMLSLKVLLTLIVVITILMATVFVGCSNPITKEDTKESSQLTYADPDEVDELWIIHPDIGLHSGLTIEDVQQIIEENADFFTIDGEIHV